MSYCFNPNCPLKNQCKRNSVPSLFTLYFKGTFDLEKGCDMYLGDMNHYNKFLLKSKRSSIIGKILKTIPKLKL